MCKDNEDKCKDDQDNRREAAKLLVSLSAQLIPAKLAMLTLTGAMLVFAWSYRDLAGLWSLGITMLVILTAASFIYGIYNAARGIANVAEGGKEGKWSTTDRKNRFDRQTLATYIGLVMLLGLVVLISIAPPKVPPKDTEIVKQLAAVEKRLSTLELMNESLRKSVDERLIRVESRLLALEKAPVPAKKKAKAKRSPSRPLD